MQDSNGTTHDPSPFLSLTEAATLLKCHHNTVRAWASQGKLEAVHMGEEKVPMYRRKDVEALKQPLVNAGLILRDDKHAFPVVGIGASAGGPDSLSKLLSTLPTDLGLAYVIVQHLQAEREPIFTELLRKKTGMPIFLIENGMRLDPDRIYVAPAAAHVAVINGTFTLRAALETSRPIDAFFKALASEYQNNAIGIVLSGTGADGTDGLRAIRAEDGLTLVQDGSALEQGMPRSAQAADVVDLVVKPEEIGKVLADFVDQLYHGGHARIPSKYDNELRRILNYLYEQRGVDFSQYKEATIHRRIIRRMVLSKCSKLSEYSVLLQGMPSELDTLYNDMLINVTSFFRDPLFYQALEHHVFPALLKDRGPNDPLRIWIAACAGGDEVVSVAITLLEHIGEQGLTLPVQIFATDVNERNIEKARMGVYKKSSLQNMDPQLVKKYFQHVDGHFQVIKPIRDMCVFAKHDLLKDPPFSRVDLISCQNMLIYLENSAQERVIRSFHYALKPTGYLGLGKSEGVALASEIFDQPDRTFKVYTKKKNGTEHLALDLRFRPSPLHTTDLKNVARSPLSSSLADLDRDTEKILLGRYVPASVLVNKDLGIVRFRGNTAPFLAPATGKASLNILKMVREDLVFDLRALIQKAKKEKTTTRRSGVLMHVDEVVGSVALEVVPMGDPRDPHFLVIFKEEVKALPLAPEALKGKDLRNERERRILQLEEELSAAREQMRNAAEDAENHSQDLQAANEEVVSSNEELQSINEELETSQEELQSINEEFATINEELQVRNEALQESEERYRRLIDLMPVAVYTCDADGNLRIFNEAAERLWGRTPAVGGVKWTGAASMRTAEGQHLPLDACHMAIAIREEQAMSDVEVVVVRPDGEERAVLANPTPLYDHKGQLSGAINVLVDITERKRTELALRESEERYRQLLNALPVAVFTCDTEGRIMLYNHAATELWGKVPDPEADVWHGAHKLYTIAGKPLDHSDSPIARCMREGVAIHGAELIMERLDGTRRRVLAHPEPIRDAQGTIVGGHTVLVDITERMESAQRLELATKVGHLGLWDLDVVNDNLVWNDAVYTIHGVEKGEFIPTLERYTELVHPDDRERVGAALKDSLENDAPYQIEFRTLNANGVVNWVYTHAEVLREDGRAVRIIGGAMNITARREAEDARSKSEQRFHLLADNLPQMIYIDDPDGRTVWVNDRWIDFTGLGREELMAGKWIKDVHPEDALPMRESYEQCFAKGNDWEFTFRMMNKLGKYRWFLARCVPMRDEAGHILSWFGTNTDVTEQQEASERIRESEALFRHTADQAPVLIWISGTDKLCYWFNKPWLEFTGRSMEQEYGNGWTEGVHPDDMERCLEIYTSNFDAQKAFAMDYRLRRHDGEYRWLMDNGTPTFNAKGEFTGFIGSCFDITDRRNAETAARESEERLGLLADNMDQLAWMATPDGSMLWLNKRWEDFSGIPLDEIPERSPKELHHPDHYERVTSTLAAAAAKGENWESTFPLRSKEGKWHWFLSRVMPHKDEAGNITRWFGTSTDISEQREKEEKLRISEERYRSLFNSMDQGFCVVEMIHDEQDRPVDYRFIEVNRTFTKHTGMENVIGKCMRDMVPELDQQLVQAYAEVARTGKSLNFEQKAQATEGRWFDIYAYRVDEATRRVAVLFSDVTERKIVAERLKASEERFRLLADNIGQLAWTAGPDGTINWYNKRWFDFTGTTLEDMLSKGWSIIHHPDHKDRVTAKYHQHMVSGTDWQDTFPIKDRVGNYHWFLSRSFPVRDAEGAIVRWFGTHTDITEQKMAEDALEASAKHKDHFLATLAHELRNPLAPITNGLHILELAGDDEAMSEKTRAMMARQVQHMVRLVDDLMDLSRISRDNIDLLLERVDLDQVIATAMETSDPLVRQREHNLKITLPQGPWEVQGDVVRLTQVVSNLLNNAAKYTDRGGHIDLRLEQEGNEVAIHVKDDGIGIEAHALPLVFGMFSQVSSAEKKVEGGLGIGLHIVKRLVELHGGRIEAHSAGLGKGSEFIVWLPLLERPAKPRSAAPVVVKDAGDPDTRRVLVVDDNEDAAFTMSMILKKRGHSVEVAHDGVQALERVPDFAPHIIIMDIGMPRMNGYEACAAIRALPGGKDITIVALSGWGQEQDRQRAEEAGFDKHLVKPIASATLLQVISQNAEAG